jgi:diguanylate cyclase (GGDEF)-like protein
MTNSFASLGFHEAEPNVPPDDGTSHPGAPRAGRDARTEEFRTFLKVGIPAGFGFALFEAVLGLAYADTASLVAGLTTTAYMTIVLGWTLRTLGRQPVDTVVRGILLPMFVPIGVHGVLQPGASLLAAVLPIAVAMSYLDRRDMGRVTALAIVTAGIMTVGSDLAPIASRIPVWILLPLHLSGALAIISLLSLLVWQFRNRLQATTSELSQLVSMSRDLARTAELMEVGDLTAGYVARAVDAEECGIVYWERDADSILLYGYYPAERRTVVPETYDLANHPLTREVLAGATLIFSDDQPGADENEVAYLHSIGQRSMMMMPLIAKGRVLGAVEATSSKPSVFDASHLAKAWPFATEAAMALENYRLIDELRHQAFHDSLTGLANRNLLLDRLEHAVARRPGPMAGLNAILYLDLDDFKAVNDNVGHAVGDLLLAAVANRLVGCLRPRDTAARLGGDEFAILLEDLRAEDEANHVAARLINDLAAPFRIGDTSFVIGMSVGIAIGIPGESSAEDLLRNADFAMYRAKLLGKGRFEVFRPDLHEAATQRAILREQLRTAVENDELRLHYQPIVDLAGGAVLGVEALVRWERPNGRLLMPGDFISIAEESGFIIPIGAWILERACLDTRAWQTRHDLPGLFVTVNLSARQFQDPGLTDQVSNALAASGLDPNALVLEITESILMQTGSSTVDRLTELRRLGVRLAIDDFGTGYSSLGYLERFPVDILKIDSTFVERMGERAFRPVLARAILQLGKALGLDVVAEGIERPEQAAVLRRLGCTRGQGYLYAKPLPPDEVERLLHHGHVDLPSQDSVSRPIPMRRRSHQIA